jgi:hypothetical protein
MPAAGLAPVADPQREQLALQWKSGPSNSP